MAELEDLMGEAFCRAHEDYDEPKGAFCTLAFADGSYIDVELFRNNDISVFVVHRDDGVERPCPNLVEYIEDHMPDWDEFADSVKEECMDEWQRNGFADESDYWRYRMG